MFGRARMLKSLETLTGRACSEAVLLQQRDRTAWFAFVIPFVLIFIVFGALDLPPLIAGAAAGGAGGIGFASQTSYFILGRVDGDVVLAESSRWMANAQEIIQQKRAPVKVSLEPRFTTVEATIFKKTFVLSKAFEDRFNTIVEK